MLQLEILAVFRCKPAHKDHDNPSFQWIGLRENLQESLTHIWWENLWFPVDVSLNLNQSIENCHIFCSRWVESTNHTEPEMALESTHQCPVVLYADDFHCGGTQLRLLRSDTLSSNDVPITHNDPRVAAVPTASSQRSSGKTFGCPVCRRLADVAAATAWGRTACPRDSEWADACPHGRQVQCPGPSWCVLLDSRFEQPGCAVALQLLWVTMTNGNPI